MNLQIEESQYVYIIAAALGAVISFCFLLHQQKKYPGPWGLPYFGLYPFKCKNFHLELTEMARRRYGDIFFYRITGQLYVHLGSLEAIHEAHVKKPDCFYNRSTRYSAFRAIYDKGILTDEGESWKVQRKFIVQTFRQIASKEALSGPVADAIQTSMKRLHESEQRPVRLTDVLNEPIIKAASQMCFGSGSDYLIPSLMDSYLRLIRPLSGPASAVTGTFARYFILPWYSTYRGLFKAKYEMDSLFHKIIAKRENAIREGAAEENFVDLYLKERDERRQKGDPQAKFFKETVLASTLKELFGDGSIGIASFVATLLTDLAMRSNVQAKMREEMHHVLGDDLKTVPTLDDKTRLPYVNAVIKELLRCSAFLPAGPGLECSRETTLGGYHIPKGCTTMMNFWAANHDPKVFENPYEFRPERFLVSSPDGFKMNQKQQQPMVFGVGKHSCAGEFLTSMMAFCFITATVRNFVLKPVNAISSEDRTWLEALDTEICAIPVKAT